MPHSQFINAVQADPVSTLLQALDNSVPVILVQAGMLSTGIPQGLIADNEGLVSSAIKSGLYAEFLFVAGHWLEDFLPAGIPKLNDLYQRARGAVVANAPTSMSSMMPSSTNNQ